MALHVREQIEAALAAALTGLATSGANVFRDRDTAVQPLLSTELPGLVMREAAEDDSTLEAGTTGVRERMLRVPVEIHAKSASGYGTTLNAVAKEIEVALATSSLGGLVKWIEPRAWVKTIDASGEQPVALGVLTLELLYHTRKGSPDTAA